MAETTPLVHSLERTVASAAAAVDNERNLCVVPYAGTVTAVQYVPDTILTGANTESRTLVLLNKGAAGSGTTIVATRAFVSGQNIAADVVGAVTLSATPANLVVAAGDVLAWQSTHVGSTGLADPGGLARVEITRS